MNVHAQRGAVGEARVIAKLTEMGYICSVPVVHNARYDVVIDGPVANARVQVKRGYFSDGKFRVDLRGKNSYNGKEAYTEDEIDAFIIYNARDDEAYWFWFDETPKTGMKRDISSYRPNEITLRLDPNY